MINSCPIATEFYKSNKFNENISFSFSLATVEDIKNIIFNLKSDAYGCDEISARMLKLCVPVIAPYLTHIINCCLEVGFFPYLWRFSLVRPLPKITQPNCFSDLRPISILPALSKALERIIYSQLYNYIVDDKITTEHQSGFKKGYSTTSLLLNISDQVIRSLDSGLATALILLDYSKAFDTLDHLLLCAKLKFIGCDNTCINFFKSYLEQRFQKVIIDNHSSNFAPISSGVPQGSILGPLLFIIYTFDIYKFVEHCNLQAFADDTQLYYSFNPNQLDTASCTINSDLQSIEDYSKRHNLKLNPNKCKVISFSPRHFQDAVRNELNLKLNDIPLESVASSRNLGIVFDCELRFKEYVALLIKKSFLALRLLYRNGGILSRKLRRELVESLVLPILSYGITLYYPCLDSLTKYRLQKMQNCCCRFIFGLRKYDHVSEKFKSLRWLKIDNLFNYQLSVLVHKILSTSSPEYLHQKLIFRGEIHKLNVRSVGSLNLPKSRLVIFNRSFSYNAVKVYNNIPNQFKSLSLRLFRKGVKLMFIQNQAK
jgi:Reverse transcriptase (RNA-dependent DNA polymerase)